PVGDEPQERRFNPAGFVLLGMLALVVFALVLASSSLRSARNFEPAPLPPPTPIATETQEPEEPEATPEEEPEPTPEKEEPKPIKIKEAVSYDPSTGAGENQDLAHLAIDDDPSTICAPFRTTTLRMRARTDSGSPSSSMTRRRFRRWSSSSTERVARSKCARVIRRTRRRGTYSPRARSTTRRPSRSRSRWKPTRSCCGSPNCPSPIPTE